MGKQQLTYSEHPTRAARIAHAKGDRQFRSYDTSYIRPRKRNIAPFIVAALVIVALAVGVFFFVRGTVEPETTLLPPGEQAIVQVQAGEGAGDIAKTLFDAHLVKKKSIFMDAVNKQNAASKLIPGAYLFTGGVSVDQILKCLITGPQSTADTLVIPEGYTRKQVAAAVADATKNRITSQQFMDASSNASNYAGSYDFLKEAGTKSLEGFLFPKTYYVTAADTAENVVKMMLDQFKAETANLDWAYPESQDLSMYDALILASIVEKEATEANRPTVASVFFNRLASDHPYLESDATTAYEVGGDPTAEQVHADTPYGTYANPGLPPTPICSPGLSCLQAVCNPEKTDYLFFYFTPNADGTMNYSFSETYEEHQDAIAAS